MLWRLARGILPTRSALYRRGIQIEDVCGVCNTMFETQWHLFVDCSFARGCWDRVGLREETNRLRDSTDSFKDWILTAISSLSAQKLQVLAAVIDGVWFERNKRVWREEETPSFVVARKALEAAKEWADTYVESGSNRSGRQPDCGMWHPPAMGTLKCNVDGALFAERHLHGAGMILRNHNGDVLAFKAMNSRGCPNAKTCEALALREAIIWLKSKGIRNVVIETDAQLVCSALGKEETDTTEFGDVISQCRDMLDPLMIIRHVRRSGNETAHALARQSRNLVTPLVGVTLPFWLADALGCICLEH
ncbi:Putative ribonuclease H protein At1g65750 [Linum perenne]